jgi:hypothetical protein
MALLLQAVLTRYRFFTFAHSLLGALSIWLAFEYFAFWVDRTQQHRAQRSENQGHHISVDTELALMSKKGRCIAAKEYRSDYDEGLWTFGVALGSCAAASYKVN